jgi:hypothetical protein
VSDAGHAEEEKVMGVEYLHRAAHQGLISPKFHFAALLLEGRAFERNAIQSVHDVKLVADQSSITGQTEHAECIRESGHYLRLVVAQGDSRAQCDWDFVIIQFL